MAALAALLRLREPLGSFRLAVVAAVEQRAMVLLAVLALLL